MHHGNANFRRWLRLCCAGLAALYALNVSAFGFVSGGKEWPDTFSISGSWSYVITATGAAKGMQGTVSWTLNGTAVERSPGVWAYRVNYTINRTRQRKKDPGTTIPNAYILTPQLYVYVHHSFLPFGPNDAPNFGAAGMISAGNDIPAWWDPVPTDGLYTVTGSMENNIASKPNTFSRSIQITADKYHYSFHNDTDRMRTYEIRDNNGDLIKRIVLPPGGKETGTFTGSGGGAPFANSGPSGGFGNLDGSTGFKLDNSGQLHPTNTYDPDKDFIDFENSKEEPVTKLPNQNSPPPDAPKDPDPLIWDRASDASKNLTDDIYRVGTKAITDRLDALIKKPTGGGGGETTVNVDVNTEGIENRLDDIKDNTGAMKDAVDQMIESANEQAGEDGERKFTTANVEQRSEAAFNAVKGAAEGAGNAVQAAVDAAMADTMPTVPGPVADPSATESGVITLSIGPGKTVVIPKNPFSPSGPFDGIIGQVAAFIKKLLAWGIVAAFVIWAHRRLQEMIEAPFNVAPFGTSISDAANSFRLFGNGGGWGIIVRATCLAILLPIVLTLPLIGTAALTAGLPWGEVKSVFSAGVGNLPSSGMLGKALWLSDHVIPWVTLVTAPVWYFTTQYILFPSKLWWMIFMKFVAV